MNGNTNYGSGTSSKIGINNTSIGQAVLSKNIDANNNTGLGAYSLYNNTNGINNVAIGTNSMLFNQTGSNNVGLGPATLMNNQVSGLVAIGANSLENNTTGVNNTAIGTLSLYNNTIGINNTAVGIGALNNNISGNSNIAIGPYVLNTNTTGNQNIGIGEGSLNKLNSDANVGVGHGALNNITTGYNNTAIGNMAYNTGNYSFSTAIGYNSVVTGNNQVVLGTSSETVIIPGGITGRAASFTSLLVNGNPVATTNELPTQQNLDNYAQLSGATFSGDISCISTGYFNNLYSNGTQVATISNVNNITENILPSSYAQLSGATFSGDISSQKNGYFSDLYIDNIPVATLSDTQTIENNLSFYSLLSGATFSGPIYSTNGSFQQLNLNGTITQTYTNYPITNSQQIGYQTNNILTINNTTPSTNNSISSPFLNAGVWLVEGQIIINIAQGITVYCTITLISTNNSGGNNNDKSTELYLNGDIPTTSSHISGIFVFNNTDNNIVTFSISNPNPGNIYPYITSTSSITLTCTRIA